MESINTRKRVLVSPLSARHLHTHRPWLVIQKSRSSSSISHLKKMMMMIPDVGWTLWEVSWLIALWRPSPFVFARRLLMDLFFYLFARPFFFYFRLWNKRHRLQQPTLKGAVLPFWSAKFWLHAARRWLENKLKFFLLLSIAKSWTVDFLFYLFFLRTL